jgi:hypothetical protein
MKDPSLTPTMLEALGKLEQSNFRKMAGWTIKPSGKRSLTGVKCADTAEKMCYTYKRGKQSITYICARITRGRALIEIDTQCAQPSNDTLVSVANVVFQRLEEAGVVSAQAKQ